MLQAIDTILFILIAYVVLMVSAEHLPPNYAAGISLLVLLVGFAAVVRAAMPRRRR